MGKRFTITVPIFVLNQVIDTYSILKKEPSMSKVYVLDFHAKLIQFYKNEMKFYKNQTETNKMTLNMFNLLIWHSFYVHISLADIEIIAEMMNYKYSGPHYYESYLIDFIKKINVNPINITDLEYENIILCVAKTTNYTGKLINDFTSEKTILQSYVEFLPILKHSQILYFNILFNKYLRAIYNIEPQSKDFITYNFIHEYFHAECTNSSDFYRRIFFQNFQKLKDYKIDSFFIMSLRKKELLYDFIVCLKIYSKIFRDADQKFFTFDNSGYLIIKDLTNSLSMFYHRENKKYFTKFWGKKNANVNNVLTLDL